MYNENYNIKEVCNFRFGSLSSLWKESGFLFLTIRRKKISVFLN